MLPDGVHHATLAEVRERFVTEAPEATRARRDMIFRGVELHIERVLLAFKDSNVRVWLNGGFVSHKPWGPPGDADIAFLVPAAVYSRVTSDKALPLWTLAEVTAKLADGRPVVTSKLHTCLGLTEGYAVNADNPNSVELQRRTWSRVKGPDDEIIDGAVKGFVEVTPDG